MYVKVDIPRKVTTKWLDRAFAPLSDYLHRERPDEARNIIPYMMFMGNEDNQFYYKNCITRDAFILDQAGNLVYCGQESLRYQFDFFNGEKVNRPPIGERFVHPNVNRWMARSLSRKADSKYGEEISIFLQEFWGPIVNYDFGDLLTGYPISGTPPQYTLYIYPANFPRQIVFIFPGDEIVEDRCSFAQYSLYQKRERELIYGGWHAITIFREVLDRNLDHFLQYLSKAIQLGAPR